jgi:hypothetical protein
MNFESCQDFFASCAKFELVLQFSAGNYWAWIMAVKKKKASELTKFDYYQAKELFEMGAMKLDDLAKRYNVDKQSLSLRFSRDGIIEGIRLNEAMRHEPAALDDDIDIIMARAKDTKDEHYKWSTLLSKLAMRKIHKAETGENGYDYETAEQEIRTISLAMKVTGEGRKERYAVLGLDKEDLLTNDLPELEISEMTEAEVIGVKREQVKKLQDTGGLAHDMVIDEEGNLIE